MNQSSRQPTPIHMNSQSMDMPPNRSSESRDYLRNAGPNQYVTFEIFDLAFKKLWLIINKLELQYMELTQNDKMSQLDKRIQNLEEFMHKINQWQQPVVQDLKRTDIIETVSQRITPLEEALSTVTRVVSDIQNEYESLKDQNEKLENDLLKLFVSLQSMLTLSNQVKVVQSEVVDIQQSLKYIYDYI